MAKAAIVCAQQKWEYMVITRRSDTYLEKELNEFGQSGWELVSVSQAKDMKGELSWTAFVKRPAVPQSHPALTPEQAVGAGSQPSPEAAEVDASSPEGFDLSGDEFDIKE